MRAYRPLIIAPDQISRENSREDLVLEEYPPGENIFFTNSTITRTKTSESNYKYQGGFSFCNHEDEVFICL